MLRLQRKHPEDALQDSTDGASPNRPRQISMIFVPCRGATSSCKHRLRTALKPGKSNGVRAAFPGRLRPHVLAQLLSAHVDLGECLAPPLKTASSSAGLRRARWLSAWSKHCCGALTENWFWTAQENSTTRRQTKLSGPRTSRGVDFLPEYGNI